MPYTCKSCGRYQQGQSADGVCPLPACAATRATRKEFETPTPPTNGVVWTELAKGCPRCLLQWPEAIGLLQRQPVNLLLRCRCGQTFPLALQGET